MSMPSLKLLADTVPQYGRLIVEPSWRGLVIRQQTPLMTSLICSVYRASDITVEIVSESTVVVLIAI